MTHQYNNIEYLQLTWSNWSHICDFIDKENFITGVYLHDNTKCALPNNQSSNTIGMYMKIEEKIVLVKQNEYIIKENNTIKIMTQIQFDRKRKLEKLWQ